LTSNSLSPFALQPAKRFVRQPALPAISDCRAAPVTAIPAMFRFDKKIAQHNAFWEASVAAIEFETIDLALNVLALCNIAYIIAA
jgi:hypothetical protein